MKKNEEKIEDIEEFITDSLEALEYANTEVRKTEIEIGITEARRQIAALS